jgi:hypothetical protein
MTVPSFPSESSPLYGPPHARRPGGLTAICVIAIILGSLGLLSSLATLASLAVGSRLQQAMMTSSSRPGRDKLFDVQRTMQKRIQAVTDRYRRPTVGFALLNMALAASMLAGGIMALNRAPKARTILLAVFAVAILFEISRSIVYVFMQCEMATVMSDMLPRILETSMPANGPNVPNAQDTAAMGTVVARAIIIVGFIFHLVLSLAKLIYYGVGWSWLRRPPARDWLESTGSSLGISA